MRKNKLSLIVIIILLLVLQAGLLVVFFSSKKLEIVGGKNEVVKNKPLETASSSEHFSYFMNREFFDEAYDAKNDDRFRTDAKVYGGILPHHLIVKNNIASFFSGLEKYDYKTLIFFAPNHFDNGKSNIIASKAIWRTPYGDIEPASALADKLGISIEEEPFIEEHAISGLVSFVRKSLPKTKILPIIIKNKTKQSDIDKLIDAIGDNTDPESTLVLASVDFSHYLPLAVADFHDNASRAVIENFDFEKIAGLEIDSPASIYTELKYLESIEAKTPQLLASSNSGQMIGDADAPSTSHNFYYFKQGQVEKEKTISMMFFGDLMLDRHVGEKINEKGFAYIFANLKGEENRFFQGVDLISANLEGAVTNKGEHYAPQNAYDFAFSPTRIAELKKYNFNFFNLSNNHFSDQGERGIIETRKNLDELKIPYVGCKDLQVDDCSTKIIEVNGYQLGMAGFSTVYGLIDIEAASIAVERLASSSDFVIVNIHWGTEYEHLNSKIQTKIAHALIDSGADMIIGHHPHVVQGIEVYKGRPIFYSLGNFIFDQYFSTDTQEGLGLAVNFDGRNLNIRLLPLESKLSRVALSVERRRVEMLDNLIKWSSLDERYVGEIREGEIKINF